MSNRKNRKLVRALALVVAAAMLLMTFFYVFAMTGWFGAALERQGFIVSAASESGTDSQDALLEHKIELLEYLIDEIRESYKDEVSLDTLFAGAYEGLFEALNDPWSVYYPSSETAAQILQSIEGEYGGVGVTMKDVSGKVVVMETVVDSPAYQAGIKTGDTVLKVDGTDTAGMMIEDVSMLIRGEPGTTVKLTVERDGALLLFTMTRKIIQITSVSSHMMEGNIGYIRISSFDSNTHAEFKAARLTLLNKGMTGLIIDLRNNGGGLMSSALDIADQLIPTLGPITYFQRQGEIIETIYSTEDATKAVPTVVLINAYTASASECLAGALQDRGIATLIGETSYGKGIAQILSETGDGSALKLSIFYFLTPDKTVIHGNGIIPDALINSSGGLSEEEIAEISKVLAPMTEVLKYFAGGVGLNVYAAQQRLDYLGYETNLTAVMDSKTIAAIKEFQADYKLYPYGGLDFTTTKALRDAFDAYINPNADDVQLEKALEVLAQ